MASFNCFRKKNKYYCFLYCTWECKENDVNNVTSPQLCLLIRENNYETAITYYMNPWLQSQVRWRQFLGRRRKWNSQNRPKKGLKPIIFLHVYQGTMDQLFTKNKISFHNPFNIDLVSKIISLGMFKSFEISQKKKKFCNVSCSMLYTRTNNMLDLC